MLVLILETFFYKMIKHALSDYLQKYDAVRTKAVIVDDGDDEPNQRVKPESACSHKFIVNVNAYTKHVHDKNIKIGDSLEME